MLATRYQPRLQHQAQRIEDAIHLAARAAVPNRDAPALPDRVGQGAEVRHLLGRMEPARGVEVEAFDQAGSAHSQLGRKRGQDLQPRGRHHGPEPELRRGSGQPGQEQRLGLVAGQAGQARAVAVDQLDPAMRTAFGIDRHAGRAERVDVAVDGPLADLELACEDGGRHPTACLQKEKELYQS